MITNEDMPEPLATAESAQLLFETIKTRTMQHGSFFEEPSDKVVGFEEGIRVSTHPAKYEYRIAGNVLHSVMPKAAGALAVGKMIIVEYWPPHYAEIAEPKYFYASNSAVVIHRGPSSLRPSHAITIAGPDDRKPWTTDCTETDAFDDPNEPTIWHGANNLQSLIAGWQIEAATNMRTATSSDVVALQAIAENLDLIDGAIKQSLPSSRRKYY